MELIYGEKTIQSLPRFKFSLVFSVSVNKKHYSNEAASIKLIEDIILSYVKEERKRLRKADQAALVIFDVFRGQITDNVLNLIKENNIKTVLFPANMANLLQPLDLTVNGYAKIFCRKRFNHWYMEQITEQLDNGKQIEKVDVKLHLTRLKPLRAKWLVELFKHMTTS